MTKKKRQKLRQNDDAETWRRNINIHPRGRRRNYVKSREIFNISNAGTPAMWPSSFPWKIPWNRTRVSVKLQALVRNFVKPTNAEKFREIGSRYRRKIDRHLYHKISSNRRKPKKSVNSTPVPALVPSQCDGSGGPWQWENAEKFRQFNYRSRSWSRSMHPWTLVYDGSGGPWQVRRSHGIFRQIDERTTLKVHPTVGVNPLYLEFKTDDDTF